jgi:UDP-N-acetyl-2-amino-2-deoxyglucuronate dehydrogenase
MIAAAPAQAKRFALIGAAGYVAPRHMKAIRDTGNHLVAALDPNDSVGVIDSFFPDADFFTEFERFDRHVDKLRRKGGKIDYVSICSPNYLHDAHIRFALRNQSCAICEKPTVLNPWNLDALQEIERETGCRVFTIHQLRLHPALVALKQRVERSAGKMHDVQVTYITPRGHWYLASWKGDLAKSGGVTVNIGLHLFDMLIWVFGAVRESAVYLNQPDAASGVLTLADARVRWFLSINARDLPGNEHDRGRRSFRSMVVDGEDVEFSDGFADLHTESYRRILDGAGFGLDVVRPSIEAASRIRNAPLARLEPGCHPRCLALHAL